MKVDKFLGMIEGLLDSAAESDRRAAWRMIARRLGGAGRAAVVGQLREAAAAAARDRRATLLDRARRLSDDV
ncbi:MAG: hypothetical protein LBK42_09255, partial [Propionibacteriaceae bacterium]|nr:hypothetical protein [Propionibacteriaceae bacterium]